MFSQCLRFRVVFSSGRLPHACSLVFSRAVKHTSFESDGQSEPENRNNLARVVSNTTSTKLDGDRMVGFRRPRGLKYL